MIEPGRQRTGGLRPGRSGALHTDGPDRPIRRGFTPSLEGQRRKRDARKTNGGRPQKGADANSGGTTMPAVSSATRSTDATKRRKATGYRERQQHAGGLDGQMHRRGVTTALDETLNSPRLVATQARGGGYIAFAGRRVRTATSLACHLYPRLDAKWCDFVAMAYAHHALCVPPRGHISSTDIVRISIDTRESTAP